MLTYTVRLGRGRTADTVAAVLEAGGERMDVAVKRPRGALADNATFCEAFAGWGRKQIDIDGPHVVGVLEVGETDDGPYVIQERIEGATVAAVLDQLRKKKRQLMPHLALRVVHGIALGLSELHSAGIVHGRLDPGEVLISFDGDVYVGDQGLHVLDPLAPSEEGDVDPYRRRDEAPGREADVLAWARVASEVLLGVRTWSESDASADELSNMVRDFSGLGSAFPKAAEEIAELLARCLREDAHRRPSDGVSVEATVRDIVDRYDLHSKPSELGAFVRALIPLRREHDAPTMVASAPPEPQKSPEISDDAEPFKVATVAIDDEILRFLHASPRPKTSRPSIDPAQLPPVVNVGENQRDVVLSGRVAVAIAGALAIVLVILLSRC